MHGFSRKVGQRVLTGGAALLLLAGCGGDKTPTGPAGGGGGGPDAEDWQLVSLGHAGLPADLQVEDCASTRFFSGRMQTTEAGAWTITLQVHDFSGDWGYLDKGEIQQDGDNYWFVSQPSGVSYPATWDGTDLKIMYDWCANGVNDVQLVFE